MLGDQRARLDDDVVDVADQLEPLVEVLTAQAQPLAENFHEVDDLEAASVADVAQLAMARMIDRRQCRHPGIGDGSELARDQLALEVRQYRQAVRLGADPRHIDLDQLDAGNDRQQLAHRRLHRWQNRPLVQCHTLADTVLHQPGEGLGVIGEKYQKRVQVEWPRAKPSLVARQCHFADLELAARAPRQHGRGPRRGEPVDCRIADPPGVGEIAFAELHLHELSVNPALDTDGVEGLHRTQTVEINRQILPQCRRDGDLNRLRGIGARWRPSALRRITA